MSAVMALKQSVCFCHVIGHTDIAVRAFHHISAAAAADKGVVSAPVHKQHRLFSVCDTVFQRFGIRVCIKINNRKILSGIADYDVEYADFVCRMLELHQ